MVRSELCELVQHSAPKTPHLSIVPEATAGVLQQEITALVVDQTSHRDIVIVITHAASRFLP